MGESAGTVFARKKAGRPPGAKDKRPRGKPGKAPLKVAKLNAKLDVLDFFASIYQDTKLDLDVRMRAASYFAPYRYPKLQAQHITVQTAGQSHAQWVKEMAAQIEASDEPELKLINGEATELVEDAPMIPLKHAHKENK